MSEQRPANVNQILNVDDIKKSYYGSSDSFFGAQNNQQPNSGEQLTPSAQYVSNEAKKLLAQRSALDSEESPSEEDLFDLISHVESLEGEELSARERTAVVASLSASLDHYHVLSPLIENPEVNDIIVRSYSDVSIQIGRKNIQTDIRFPDHASYKAFVENLLKRVGKACTLATPVVDATLDQNVRLCVTHESFSPSGSGPMLTLRVARHKNISLDGLVQQELAPKAVLEYLAGVVSTGQATILIGGEVGTGKTTLVKALASQIAEDEALLLIEDTQEIVLDRPFTRTLLTREANTEGAGRISPAQAIRTGMRMAMNRIILGEMRDAETAESFVDVCASGHAGMSTIHARSARDAVSRLELFLSRAQGSVGIDTVRRQIADAISVVVFLAVDRRDGRRRVKDVLEVGNSSDGSVQLSPMFSFVERADLPQWRRESGVSILGDSLREAGVVLPPNGEYLSFDPEHMYENAFLKYPDKSAESEGM